jgi:hypothetical protein
MASRKQEKERLRQERLEAERREAEMARRRLYLGYLVAGLLAAAVIVGLAIVILSGGDGDSEDFPAEAHIVTEFGGVVPDGLEPDGREGTTPPEIQQADLEEAAEVAGCELQLDLEDEGAGHLAPKDPEPDYGTDPPTSGDHSPQPLAEGAYATTPENVNVVHALEHGRIAIQYSPDLPDDDQLVLKGVFDESPNGVALFPNPDMPSEVAVTAWTQLMTCKSYDERVVDAIRAFRDIYRGQGPEPVSF